jgi:acylphosphatase
MVEIQAVVSGKVQAVAYRAYVQDVASLLGVVGYVHNLPDGSVLVLAQAEPAVLKELVEYLHEGSLLSKVEGVAVEWRSVKSTHEDFSIRY